MVAVDRVQDLDRLGAQAGVEGSEVIVGELARLVIELGVANLPVLGLASGLQVGELGLCGPGLGARLTALGPQRPADHDNHDGEDGEDEQEFGQGLAAIAAAGRRPRKGNGMRRASNDGAGHRAISPPQAMMSAPSQIQLTSGETMSRKLTGQGCVT